MPLTEATKGGRQSKHVQIQEAIADLNRTVHGLEDLVLIVGDGPQPKEELTAKEPFIGSLQGFLDQAPDTLYKLRDRVVKSVEELTKALL